MRVTVLGGTGKIGRQVVEQLLTAGHEVVALVRTPGKLASQHPRLTRRTGQLSDVDAVRDAVAGSDAVMPEAAQAGVVDTVPPVHVAPHGPHGSRPITAPSSGSARIVYSTDEA